MINKNRKSISIDCMLIDKSRELLNKSKNSNLDDVFLHFITSYNAGYRVVKQENGSYKIINFKRY